jgi:F-type H+-transporting ATPase subunit b
MADLANTTAGTEAPAPKGGFPPFATETFPAQIFWLAVTFAVLFIVMWRVAVPKIGGTIGDRKAKIADDLASAEASRANAEKASAEYEAALAAAHARAHALADENRKRIQGEIDTAKAKADADALDAMTKADARINTVRDEAKAHVADAARDAAVAIVARLTGETVPADEATAAVAAAR